jgi:thiol-disulfide isomerase/thioredoxin
MMKLIDEKITSPTIRRSMIQMAAQNYFLYGEGDDNSENFIKDIKAWAGKDVDVLHEMIQQFLDKRASQKATQVGTKAPDITLTDRDGKKRQLLDIVKGKLTYIDVWATWCGPCKREIPFLAKLVEKYKDNDKIQFISISVDENVDAWKKMIETDKPAWQQYNINGEVNAEFSKQWGITGIPRFIMIDGNGNIVASDATRPSDDATSKSIYELIDNK